ncbi:GlcG/HbpS family heme-binding protein [Flavisolibacter ginsenosidimutans]|uniref:Heme-binding protein n=1 Tax=Flavisolibacter ginsenosidimutans TaxID=661481 RepID=A0A5B8UL47_9BACT|nr:heme-binding protein [Flavisolibacter ginsenosidimutans]QEC57278.1 heme-binding protein [Flavisolibacter ginsenosidimutans]
MLLKKFSISLALAKQIAEKAEAEAVKQNLAVCIAVVNDAGRLVYFLKMDDSTNASGDIAIAKAQHAVNYRRDTRYHEEFLKQGQLRVLALPNTLSIEGGVQLVYDSKLIGAIGVSGAAAADDGRIATAGATFLSAIKGKE